MTENQDRPPVTDEPAPPFPGQQFPAAVLPTSGYPAAGDGRAEPAAGAPVTTEPVFPQQFPPSQPFQAIDPPSQPFPVLGPPSQPVPVLGPPSQPLPAAQAKPRNRATTVFAVLAVVFFLGAGAFAALWLVEQGNHKGTSSELGTVRADLTKTADELKSAEQARSQAESAKQSTQRDLERTKPCLDSAKRLVRALTDAEAEKQYDEMMLNC